MKKRGFFFSTDALIALIIIFLSLLVVYPIIKYSKYETDITQDISEVLSNLKISEIENSYVKNLINNKVITHLNNTILEQIGEFYVTNKTLARQLSNSILSELNTKDNIGIWFEDYLLASKNNSGIEGSREIETNRMIISGIREGESVTGFSARAFLSSDVKTKYFYFGGYVGDGNISAIINYNGQINSAEMELAINNDFKVYVNGIFQGDFEKSSEFIPLKYSLPLDDFNSGENLIEIKGSNLHIAGGFIKITYSNSVQYNENKKYSFPGIEGGINLYDGFYIPNLNDLNIHLHINCNHTFFLEIGNETIYEGSTSGEEVIELNPNLNLNDKTIPLRLGLKNASYTGEKMNADIVSVTDTSGSMCGYCQEDDFWCCLFSGGCDNDQPNCEYCEGVCQNMIYDAKEANELFVDKILNLSENRAGFVGYESEISSFHELSNNKDSLKQEINSIEAVGGTCICCGINKAVEELVNNSNEDKFQSIVIMSDGEANVQCSQQGTGNAKQDAIKAACDAYDEYGIKFYSIGFGNGADEYTLQQIADCGDGSYYYSDINELIEVYSEITEDVIEAYYEEQSLEIIGNFQSRLYPDSYIQFNYNETEYPYGLIINSEKQFDNEYSGFFNIPNDSRFIQGKVISYSGPRWTKLVNINNENIYNLSNYGEEYIRLGDPYAINLPLNYINKSNTIEVYTGTKNNNSAGSFYNKIIYKILKNMSAYSEILSYAEGCNWVIEFEDNTNITINPDYSGDNICYYTELNRQYDENDALQKAVYNLLEKLDFDLNGKLDSKIQNQNLNVETNRIIGIPFTWSTEVQIRRWE